MANSDFSMCNYALVSLGVKPMNSTTLLTSQGDRADLARTIYPTIKSYVLRKHPWNCAKTLVTLSTPDATPPAFGYANRFPLPSDWLRTMYVNTVDDNTDYETIGRFIHTNDNSIGLAYIANIDESLFDPSLTFVMQLALKAAFAYQITESTQKELACLQEFKDALKEAKSIDGQENPPEDLADDFPLLQARY